jgi:hypothetical protein
VLPRTALQIAQVVPDTKSTPVGRSRKTARRKKSQSSQSAAVPSAVRAQRPQSEVATEFFALPYAPRLTSFEGAQVLRVRLPRASMTMLGLPVDQSGFSDRIKADVVLGEDGIARAIRFVR